MNTLSCKQVKNKSNSIEINSGPINNGNYKQNCNQLETKEKLK